MLHSNSSNHRKPGTLKGQGAMLNQFRDPPQLFIYLFLLTLFNVDYKTLQDMH